MWVRMPLYTTTIIVINTTSYKKGKMEPIIWNILLKITHLVSSQMDIWTQAFHRTHEETITRSSAELRIKKVHPLARNYSPSACIKCHIRFSLERRKQEFICLGHLGCDGDKNLCGILFMGLFVLCKTSLSRGHAFIFCLIRNDQSLSYKQSGIQLLFFVPVFSFRNMLWFLVNQETWPITSDP